MQKIILIFFILLALPLAFAQTPTTLKYVCVDMPFYMQEDDKGNHSGLLIDIFKKTAKEAGYNDLHISLEPAPRMIESIISGKAHVWNGIVLPAIKDHVYIGESPIAHITLAIFYQGEKQELKNIKDLKGKNLITIRGFSYGGLLKEIKDPANQIHLMETNGHASALNMLKFKRADYLLDYLEPLKNINYQTITPTLNFSTINIFESYFMVSKKAPFAKTIMNKFNKAYKDLVQRHELPPVAPLKK